MSSYIVRSTDIVETLRRIEEIVSRSGGKIKTFRRDFIPLFQRPENRRIQYFYYCDDHKGITVRLFDSGFFAENPDFGNNRIIFRGEELGTEQSPAKQELLSVWDNHEAPPREVSTNDIENADEHFASLNGGSVQDVQESKSDDVVVWQSERYSEICKRTHLPEAFFKDCERLLETQKQIILQGAPGTGKTFVGEQLALLWAGSADRVKLVQFHESYGYEDFVFGIKPKVDPETGRTGFCPEPGTLLRLCEQVRKAGDQHHVLLIDEINRAKTARVFGELLYLLEYRDREVELQNGTSFSIPKNLFIIGTMNTTDKSIALVDYALRRRFAFIDLVPVKDGHSVVLRHWLTENGIRNADHVERLFVALNQSIAQKGEDLMIGHSYFMREEAVDEKQFSPELLSFIWQYYILPLVAEYEYQLPKDVLEKRYGLDATLALVKAQALPA